MNERAVLELRLEEVGGSWRSESERGGRRRGREDGGLVDFEEVDEEGLLGCERGGESMRKEEAGSRHVCDIRMRRKAKMVRKWEKEAEQRPNEGEGSREEKSATDLAPSSSSHRESRTRPPDPMSTTTLPRSRLPSPSELPTERPLPVLLLQEENEVHLLLRRRGEAEVLGRLIR